MWSEAAYWEGGVSCRHNDIAREGITIGIGAIFALAIAVRKLGAIVYGQAQLLSCRGCCSVGEGFPRIIHRFSGNKGGGATFDRYFPGRTGFRIDGPVATNRRGSWEGRIITAIYVAEIDGV